MAANDVFATKSTVQLRIYVERAIGHIKEYCILQGTLPASMWDSISNVMYVCSMLINFGPLWYVNVYSDSKYFNL